MKRYCWILAVVFAGALLRETARAAEAEDFTLQDFLGRSWQNECLRFPLRGPALAKARAGQALVGPDNKPVAYQVHPGESRDTHFISFLTDLGPFEKRRYHFRADPAQVTTDLRMEEADDQIRPCQRPGFVPRCW